MLIPLQQTNRQLCLVRFGIVNYTLCMRWIFLGMTAFGISLLAQSQQSVTPWRGAGPPPCAGPDGGIYACPPGPRDLAIRAGRLFDSKSGKMLTRQVVLLSGDRIAEVGPEGKVRIPAGVPVIDLTHATLLPGLIDAHTHMFNARGPNGISTESALMIAVQNAQADLRDVESGPQRSFQLEG